ncbi:ParA family protein [Klebsiella pneumoniae]|nr:ParA family protein [Klebsiella quasipneumoniae]MCC4959754.1 ParA family protein [Klebsiella pneumoniae]MCD7089501.1 ParA family protein [Klebsiella quasipneumoniae subsp. quasipneumoniae]
MSIIMFASDKGGVGKTTTALNLAVYLSGKSKKVVLVKTDKNEDLTRWKQRRADNGLSDIPLVEAYGDIRDELTRLARIADHVIVDCAGYDNQEYRYGLLASDIFVTPVKPSSRLETDTLENISATVRRAKEGNPDIRSYALFTRVKHNRMQAKITLGKHLTKAKGVISPLKTFISELDVFEDCVNEGAGVHDAERASSLTKAKAQIELMTHELGLLA